jgi:hypothetical protein
MATTTTKKPVKTPRPVLKRAVAEGMRWVNRYGAMPELAEIVQAIRELDHTVHRRSLLDFPMPPSR